MNTMNIHRAVQIALVAHDGQTRKGKDTPYIIHPVRVGALLTYADASEDTIIAGILHDTLEDTFLTATDIESMFGSKVLDIVQSETQLPKKDYTWKERRAEARNRIKDFSYETTLVKTADLLDNVFESLDDLETWGIISLTPAQLYHYTLSAQLLSKKPGNNPLMPALLDTIKTLTEKGEYQFDEKDI